MVRKRKRGKGKSFDEMILIDSQSEVPELEFYDDSFLDAR